MRNPVDECLAAVRSYRCRNLNLPYRKEEDKMLETNFNIKFEDNRSPDEIAREIELHQYRRKLKEADLKIDKLESQLIKFRELIEPTKIIRNNRTTIVIWNDGTKTIVRCEPHKNYDAYEAFTAALAKKIYGNNTRLKKMILEKFTSQT